MMEPDIENNKKDKRKTLNIDISVYETKVSAARLHIIELKEQKGFVMILRMIHIENVKTNDIFMSSMSDLKLKKFVPFGAVLKENPANINELRFQSGNYFKKIDSSSIYRKTNSQNYQ